MKTEITVGDGKYTLVHNNGAHFHCLRYGEVWRDLVGDGMVLALVQRIEELEEQVAELKQDLQVANDGLNELGERE